MDATRVTEGEPNEIQVAKDLRYNLEPEPTDPDLRARFESLTPAERDTFYKRRKWMVSVLLRALTFQALIGGIEWTRDQMRVLKSALPTRAETPADYLAENDDELPPIRIDALSDFVNGVPFAEPAPTTLRERGAVVVESMVTNFVQAMWEDAAFVARAKSIGLTFGVGGVVNISKSGSGLFWGHSAMIDIGFDFENRAGYMRLNYDRQHLDDSKFGIDLSGTLTFGLHLLNQQKEAEPSEYQLKHSRYPFGLSRDQGTGYRLYGFQPAFHALEIVGAITTLHGMPLTGAALATTGMFAAWLSIYKTNIRRHILMNTLPRILKRRRIRGAACHEIYL